MNYLIYLLLISFFYSNVIFSINKLPFLASDIISILIIIYFIVNLLIQGNYKLRIKDNVVKSYAVFIIYGVFGVLFYLLRSEQLAYIGDSLVTIYPFILLFILLIILDNWNFKINENKIHIIIIFLGLITSIFGIVFDFIIQVPRDYISVSGLVSRPVPLVTSTFTSHYGSVVLYLVVSLSSLEILRFKDEIKKAVLYYPILICIISAILLSGSRRGLVLLIVFYGIVLFYKFYLHFKIKINALRTIGNIIAIITIFFAVAVGFNYYESYLEENSRIYNKLAEESIFEDDGRELITESAINTLKSNPLILVFGNGIGTYSSIESTYGTAAHNMYLQYLVEIGILGSFLFYIFMFFQVKKKKEEPQGLYIVKLALMVSILVLGLTGEVFYPAQSFANFFIFINVYFYLLNNVRETETIDLKNDI